MSANPMNQRGQAMVETAILMIVLVPLLLYAFFLCGVGFHRLEIQEAVVSTVWDFSARNIEADPTEYSDRKTANSYDADAVGGFNRLLYVDHISAYDDLAGDFHGDDEHHHVEFGVHVCWIGPEQDVPDPANPGKTKKSYTTKGSDYDAPGSTEVVCDVNSDNDIDWMVPTGGKKFATSNLNRGGLARCWAKAWVYNYLIPQTFMPEHSNEDLNGGKTMRGNVATDGYGNGVHGVRGEGGTARNIFLRDRASISFGTWGIMNGADKAGGWKLSDADIGGPSPGMFTLSETLVASDNPFYQRVKYIYKSEQATQATWAAVAAGYASYCGQAASKKLEIVADLSTDPNAGVTPFNAYAVLAPYLVARYKPGQPYSSVGRWNANLESTPYTSYNGDKYTSAYNKRGPYYMGNKNPVR